MLLPQNKVLLDLSPHNRAVDKGNSLQGGEALVDLHHLNDGGNNLHFDRGKGRDMAL